MPRSIGIDLGTTNTAIAALVDGKPVLLTNSKGHTIIPSAIFINKKGKVVVGEKARTSALTSPERGAYAVKRLIGLRHDSVEVQALANRVAYPILPAEDGSCIVEIAGQKLTPVKVASLILGEAKKIAEEALDDEVDGAVITVPAHFNHAQRSATKEAAELAGLRCDRIINEPTSAALAYGHKKTDDRVVLVYDLGGGTFDVSILQYEVSIVETKSTVGDTRLGGEDFDEVLLVHILENIKKTHNVDLADNDVALQRIKDAAEKAKCDLSSKMSSTVNIPYLTQKINLEMTITRSEYEQLVQHLIDRSITVVERAIREAGFIKEEINEVVLVGGQSRMPKIHQTLKEYFGIAPSKGVHPDEAVALGAALHAATLSDESVDGPLLIDVTPFDIGIDIAGGLFEKIIQRNTAVPTEFTKKFFAARSGQKIIDFVIRQGESRIAKENEFLGVFSMSGLTITDSGLASVEVTFRIDSNGMLQVTAKEEATGEKAHIKVKNYAEYVKSQDGIALDVEEQSIQIGNEEEEDDTSGISGKVGFFQKLFGKRGNTKTPVSEDIAENLQDELETNTTQVEREEHLDISQDEDSLDSLLGDDNHQEIHLDDIEADMSLDELLADSYSEPLQFGMADSTAAIQSNQTEDQSEKKKQNISTHASDAKQLSELELDVLTIEDIEIEEEQISFEDENLDENKEELETNDTSEIDSLLDEMILTEEEHASQLNHQSNNTVEEVEVELDEFDSLDVEIDDELDVEVDVEEVEEVEEAELDEFDSLDVEVEVEVEEVELDEFDSLDVEIDELDDIFDEDNLDEISIDLDETDKNETGADKQDQIEQSRTVSTEEENSNQSIDDDLEIDIDLDFDFDSLSAELDDLLVETTDVTQEEPVKTEQSKDMVDPQKKNNN